MADTSASSGTAYQNASTYLFVPRSYGDTSTAGDDINMPGAYFRLGGFSDAENAVRMAASPSIFPATPVGNARPVPNANGNLTPFYPRQHISDEGQADAVTNAAGSQADQLGIMLACNGRLLIRSAEKTYLHSVGDIDIDTQGKLTVYADGAVAITSQDEIAITSGTKKNITISAGADDTQLGDVEINAYTATRRVAGKNYEYTTEDSYSYCQANAYSYMLGGTVDVVLGGALSFTMATKLSVSVSVEMQIALSALIGITAYKFDVAGISLEFVSSKVDLKEVEFGVAALKGNSTAVRAEVVQARADAATIAAKTAAVVSEFATVKSAVAAAQTAVGGPDVKMNAFIMAL